jgi:antitoxin (DNA-binding transcriptional repressor) of toxin-antitoxin stability system
LKIKNKYGMINAMKIIISKTQFGPNMSKYFRKVEEKKIKLVITHLGKPVIEIIPVKFDKREDEKTLNFLMNTVIEYKDPTKPVDENWEALK